MQLQSFVGNFVVSSPPSSIALLLASLLLLRLFALLARFLLG